MDPDKLQAAVAELERQLGGSKGIDDESRVVLEQTLRDIRAALQEDQRSDAERHSLIERLRGAAEDFGGSHPTLTGTLMRLVDGLGEMGI